MLKYPNVTLEHTTPRIEHYRNVLATPFEVSEHPVPTVTGCLYDETRRLIGLSQRIGGHYGDFYPSLDPREISVETQSVRSIPGRSLYLGHYMAHYGHFLLETLSTFWPFGSFREYDSFVFHPFTFGPNMTGFAYEAFEVFGIEGDQVEIISGPTVLEDVTIPERLICLNHSANAHVRTVYAKIRDVLG